MSKMINFKSQRREIAILLFSITIFISVCDGSIQDNTIKVGILHSLTGTMAISEKSVVDATLLAIEQIQAQNGLLGREIEVLVVDGRSDLLTFAKEAERLIVEEGVSVIFGCWTSACRKIVKPIVEKHGNLLFYPVQYEGIEVSPNIVYTGATPNQQIIPAVKWSFDNLGKRFFLVGSDYVFPRTANRIIRDLALILGAEIVGEEYQPLGSREFKGIIQKIAKSNPDLIINTINGDSNKRFFEELRKAGISSDSIPTISFSIGENELKSIGVALMVGDYAAWNYFQSIKSAENNKFVRDFKDRYSEDRVISDPMEAAYISVHLWAKSVKEAKSVEIEKVLEALRRQSFRAPEGMVFVESSNNHIWKTVRIGKVESDGQYKIVWDSGKPIRPIPFPQNRSLLEWQKFLQSLYESWGNNWASSLK